MASSHPHQGRCPRGPYSASCHRVFDCMNYRSSRCRRRSGRRPYKRRVVEIAVLPWASSISHSPRFRFPWDRDCFFDPTGILASMTGTTILWWTAGLNVAAIITAPITALWAQRKGDDNRALKKRHDDIFRALWINRARPMYLARVDSLNMIDVEFFGVAKVMDASGLSAKSPNGPLCRESLPYPYLSARPESILE
jgi:hypothetical protein